MVLVNGFLTVYGVCIIAETQRRAEETKKNDSPSRNPERRIVRAEESMARRAKEQVYRSVEKVNLIQSSLGERRLAFAPCLSLVREVGD